NGVAGNGTARSNQPPSVRPVPDDRFATEGEAAEGLSGPGAARRWIAAGGLAALAAAGILLSGTQQPPPPDPNLLAIAPFDVLDPSLQLWHEGLVDILARALDGAGPLRTVPQTVGLKRWQGRADRVSAERFGHHTGAGLVVFGTIQRTRDTV